MVKALNNIYFSIVILCFILYIFHYIMNTGYRFKNFKHFIIACILSFIPIINVFNLLFLGGGLLVCIFEDDC